MIDFLGKYLILESIEQQLTDAIKNHQTVTLHYKGNKGTTNPKTGKTMGKRSDFTDSGLRYVIPVALGLHSSSGSVVLRALVTSKGIHTAGRERPTKWRMFRIDRITSIYPHEDPNAIKDAMPELYNQEGDDHMSIIYAKADYSGTTDTMPSNEPSISSAGQKRAWNEPSEASKKKVLKIPAKPSAPIQPPPVQPTPQQPIKKPSTQPVPIPKPAPVAPTTVPPVTPPVAPPNMAEPIEPEVPNQPKPLKEWYIWLNKILNN